MAATVSQGRIVITRVAKDALTKGVPCWFYPTVTNQVTATTVASSDTGIINFMAGIPLDDYAAGELAEICLTGVCQVKIATGTGVVAGAPIMVSDTSGSVVVGAVQRTIIGICLESPSNAANASGDLVECYVFPGAHFRAAAS